MNNQDPNYTEMTDTKGVEAPPADPSEKEASQEQMISLLNAASALTGDKAADADSSSAPKSNLNGSKSAELEDDVPMTFPQKLMEIVSNEDHQDVVSWLPHGKGFIIYKKKKFATEILPRYFKQSKYTSFTRKLNRWGFSRVTRGPETGAYYHKFFQRGDLRLCMQMSCQTAKNSNMMAHQMPMGFPGNPIGLPKGMFPGAPVDLSQQHLIRHQLQQLQLQQLQLQQMQMQQHQQQLQAAEMFRQAMENKSGETPAAADSGENNNDNKAIERKSDPGNNNLYLQSLQQPPLGLLPALQASTALAQQQQQASVPPSQGNPLAAPSEASIANTATKTWAA